MRCDREQIYNFFIDTLYLCMSDFPHSKNIKLFLRAIQYGYCGLGT